MPALEICLSFRIEACCGAEDKKKSKKIFFLLCQKSRYGLATSLNKKFQSANGWTTAATLILYVLLRFHEQSYGYSVWTTVFDYPMLGCGFTALILSALSPGSLLYRIRIPGAASLAIGSYAIYLSREAVLSMAKAMLNQLNIGLESVNGILVIVVASLLCGWILFSVCRTFGDGVE